MTNAIFYMRLLTIHVGIEKFSFFLFTIMANQKVQKTKEKVVLSCHHWKTMLEEALAAISAEKVSEQFFMYTTK